MSSANKHLLLVLTLFAILLGTIFFIRYTTTGGLLLGQESYSTLRLAETIKEKGITAPDILSYGGRPTLTEKGLAFLLSFSPLFLARILPFLLGLLSLYFFFKIIHFFKPELALLSSILLISNPTTLFLYSTITKYTLSLTLLLAALYFFLHKKDILSLFLLLLLPFVSYLTSILAFLFVTFRKKNKTHYFILSISYLLFVIFFLVTLIKLGTPQLPNFNVNEFGTGFLQHGFLAEFGGSFGLGTFFFILALTGIYFAFEKNYHYLLAYLLFIPLLLLVSSIPALLFFSNFLFAFYAAYSCRWILTREWKIPQLKMIIFTVLFCGILFSPLAYINRISLIEPDKYTGQALQFLTTQKGEDTVFSSYTNGIFINTANKRNVMDTHFLYAPSLNQRWQDSQTLFHTTDLETARRILHKYHANYFYIDKHMKEELWSTQESELLFLLTYGSKVFGKIYSNEEVEIYLVY